MITQFPYQSKEWWKEYYRLNRDKLRAYKNEYDRIRYKTHYKVEKARRDRWILKNPSKVKAHQIVRYAVKTGKLIRKPCEICHISDVRIIAHHNDYSKSLEVIWLCETHHKKQHLI